VPEASILICVHGKLELTRRCLDAIAATAPAGRYEVVVVDNASPDGSGDALEALAATYPAPLKVIRSAENLGFVGGNNLAAGHASGHHLLLLNNDTEPRPGWFEALLATCERDPSVGAVGAKLVYPDGRLQEAGGIVFADASGWNYGRGGDPDDPRYGFVRDVDYCSAACLLVPRAVWDELGGFDERYAPAYYEDTDLCFAVRGLGLRVVYQPAAVIVHHEGATAGTDTASGFKRHQVSNRETFRAKWADALRAQQPPHPALVRRASHRVAGKRILVVDPLMPMYDRASGSRRLHELLLLLAAAGHAVTFVARECAGEDRYRGPLEAAGVEVYDGDPDRLPQSRRARRLDLPGLLHETRYDVAILCFHDLAAQYMPLVREHSPLTRIAVDSVDVHYVREEREAALTGDPVVAQRAAGTKKRELATYAAADAVLVVTEEDRAALLAELPEADVHVVPNVHEPGVEDPSSPGDRDGLLFVGNFRHPPNADAVGWLCTEILPLVRRELPDVRLTVVGDVPPPAVQAFAGDRVEVTGWVPVLEPYLASHRLSVAPLRFGAGMKGKVGEALAHGVPVVTTAIGAEGMVDGTPEDSGLAVADDPQAFADAIVRLVRDDAAWSRLAEAGRAHVARRYGRAPAAAALERLLAAESTQAVLAETTSIVILAHGERELTEACLASIEAHTPEPHELILVDNGSPDDTAALFERRAAERGNVRAVLNRRNAGFAAGCNLGLALARGGTVLLLNNDTLVTPGWLGRLRSALRDRSVGVAGPVSNNVSGPQLVADTAYGDPYADPGALHAFAADRAAANAGASAPVPRVVGFCLLARREALYRIGGLEPRFGPGNFEDDDLCLRIQAAGFGARIALDAFVHHEGSRTFAAAKVDWTRAMIRNWTVFKELWGLPADAPLEGGYELRPERLAPPARYVPLPAIGASHATADGRVFREDSQRVALEQGVQAVSGGEATALREAFAEAAGWSDPHRRYQTRRRLVQAVFDSGTTDPSLLAAAAGGLLAALEDEPREPVLLNELGVLVYGLRDGRSAERLFAAARHLDPALPGIDDNLAAARELARVPRERSGRHTGPLKALAARVEAVARRAVPADGMRISLCMIVKDEEELLPACLSAVAGHVDEIVVVDTGSTDRTVEIATSFGATVIEFPWNGSFADARNVSLDAATGDWILWLDADEVLDERHGPLLRELAGRTWREGFYLRMTSVLGDDAEGGFVHQTMRLFRNRPEYRFVGRIHEQHTHEMPLHLPERFEVADLHVLHHGYGAERVAAREKGDRNRSLLELEVAENAGDPFTLFNLGTEHLGAGRAAEAAELLSAAWIAAIAAGGTAPQYLPSLAVRLLQALRLAGRPAQAVATAEQALAVYPEHTDLVREAALSARDTGDLEKAAALAERCLELGDAPARYAGAIGAGTFLALGLLASIRSAQHRYDEAAVLLDRSLADHPSFTQARTALAEVEALRGADGLLRIAASGDAAALAATLDAADVPTETLDLYAAWLEALAGRPAELPVESAPAALAALDRLLELQEFDAFEMLVGLWETLPLAERDRRELLAGIYMARGFVDSAAEEWLAIASAEPTGPALTGLARVAHARGLADDALALVDEALRLDPTIEEARTLRAALAKAA
jgi:GT2 family glycosyltransferase/glycosyltransferase involved in cell wall biosynthesis/tetratricopeptide (TPR) repeat protein